MSLRTKPQWNFNQNTKLFFHEIASKYIVCQMEAILSWGRWVNLYAKNTLLLLKLEYSGHICKCHGCWYPGSLCHQISSNHCIDCVTGRADTTLVRHKLHIKYNLQHYWLTPAIISHFDKCPSNGSGSNRDTVWHWPPRIINGHGINCLGVSGYMFNRISMA